LFLSVAAIQHSTCADGCEVVWSVLVTDTQTVVQAHFGHQCAQSVPDMTYNVFGGTLNPTLLLLLQSPANGRLVRSHGG